MRYSSLGLTGYLQCFFLKPDGYCSGPVLLFSILVAILKYFMLQYKKEG